MKFTNMLAASAIIALSTVPTADAKLTDVTQFWKLRAVYYEQPVFWFSLVNALQDTTD